MKTMLNVIKFTKNQNINKESVIILLFRDGLDVIYVQEHEKKTSKRIFAYKNIIIFAPYF